MSDTTYVPSDRCPHTKRYKSVCDCGQCEVPVPKELSQSAKADARWVEDQSVERRADIEKQQQVCIASVLIRVLASPLCSATELTPGLF